MIRSKEDLKFYLEQDKIALLEYDDQKYPRPFYDEVWKFQRALRKAEYAVNCRAGIFFLPYRIFRKIIFHRHSVKCGFTIPLNVFEHGLSIAHYGTIVVNSNAKVGKNCRIQEGVNIGSSGGNEAPIIGNNVFIGTGAKIFGDISIADGVAIGAGAIVNKSVEEAGVSVAGNPAKIVSYNGAKRFISNKLEGNYSNESSAH